MEDTPIILHRKRFQELTVDELYEQVGFRQSSEPFILDGIPHIRMTWEEPSPCTE